MLNANAQATQQEVKREVPKPYALYLELMNKLETAQREINALLRELESLGYPLQVGFIQGGFYVDWSRGKHPYAAVLDAMMKE